MLNRRQAHHQAVISHYTTITVQAMAAILGKDSSVCRRLMPAKSSISYATHRTRCFHHLKQVHQVVKVRLNLAVRTLITHATFWSFHKTPSTRPLLHPMCKLTWPCRQKQHRCKAIREAILVRSTHHRTNPVRTTRLNRSLATRESS